MPKVVTLRRLPVYTNKGQKEDDSFNAFTCKRCRTHLLTTDADLSNLPRRRTDGALVLDARISVVKLYTVKREGSQVVRREKGVERQYVHACPSCDKDVGYTSKPHEDRAAVLRILEEDAHPTPPPMPPPTAASRVPAMPRPDWVQADAWDGMSEEDRAAVLQALADDAIREAPAPSRPAPSRPLPHQKPWIMGGPAWPRRTGQLYCGLWAKMLTRRRVHTKKAHRHRLPERQGR
ncbi:unnamed protein product [Effrenium voratum]|nr:unnamed protein product [Effrenium voratum]